MTPRIPATVITGFLGAGKTTLIRHMLMNAEGRRIALIINEFGDLGVDGDILKGCGEAVCRAEDIVELSNGCICCTVAEDFVPTLEKLLARPDRPDHIVIETSGLALPQPLVRAFGWPAIKGRVTVDGVVTVVDGAALSEGRFAHDEAALAAQREGDATLDHETPISELFEDQLACADLIVVNKIDLLAPEAVERLTVSLAEGARPGVRVLRSERGALPVGVLLGQGIGAEDDLDARQSHHEAEGHDQDHGHDEFESFVLSLPEIADAKAFAARVAGVMQAQGILRLKGFCAVAGKPMRLTLQAVGPRVETSFEGPFPPGTPRETRLVVIGEAGLDRAAIRAAIEAAAGVALA